MIGEILTKLVAKPLAASKTLSAAAAIAFTSVCESLLLACGSSLATDVSRIKEALLKSMEARTQSEQAGARKKMAEATTAANQVIRKLHAEEHAHLETEHLALENRKKAAEAAESEAKADSARTEAAVAKMRAYEEAKKVFKTGRKKTFTAKERQLFDALRQLQSEGGQLYVDKTKLNKLQKRMPNQSGGHVR